MAKRLAQSRKADLVTLAEEVVKYHSAEGRATNLLKIVSENEIGLHFDDYGNSFDGALEIADGQFHIHVNLSKCISPDSGRSRFTLAHELGHFFIEEHRHALISGEQPHGSTCGMFDSADTPEELEADIFAAYLLMPPSKFISAIRSSDSPLAAIKHLATLFRSSLTSTAIHYASVAADRCAIVRWTADGEFAWPRIGKGYYAEGFRRLQYANGSIPAPDSATGIVIAGSEQESETVSTTPVLFTHVAAGRFRDHLLKEEAIALGEYGFMTIISDLDI